MNTSKQTALAFILNNGPQSLLSAEQEIELGTRIQQGLRLLEKKESGEELSAEELFLIEDGKLARDELVTHNIKLVTHVAKQFQGYRIELAELVQEGIIGCITAADKYDPTRGFRFSTCAVPWIKQQINRYVQAHKKMVRLPAHVTDAISKINKLTEEYMQLHDGQEPTNEQLSELSGGKLTVENIELSKNAALPISSLNTIIGDEEDTELGDLVEDENDISPDEYTMQSELRSLLESFIETLPDIQQKIIRLRYGLNEKNKEYTLEEVGQMLNFTRERIRQLEQDALVTIRVRADRAGTFKEMF